MTVSKAATAASYLERLDYTSEEFSEVKVMETPGVNENSMFMECVSQGTELKDHANMCNNGSSISCTSTERWHGNSSRNNDRHYNKPHATELANTLARCIQNAKIESGILSAHAYLENTTPSGKVKEKCHISLGATAGVIALSAFSSICMTLNLSPQKQSSKEYRGKDS